MWSKRLGVVAQTMGYIPRLFGKRAIEFEHQLAYEEWLADKYKVGDLLTYKQQPDLVHANWPCVLLVTKVQEDYTDLQWDYTTGMPKYANIVGIYKNAATNGNGFHERYDEALSFRPLTQKETEWFIKDVEFQNCLQKHFPDFKPNYREQGNNTPARAGEEQV